ncbi:Hypoxanthine-guanine phosphoribosyltransferase [Phytophthora cinnamomi]|uniref:Hypoxanthine-guanine phosphoribosyltransferase n=1 Tax=Phytophthora cinnamomi TaxID=4785 RepID=UPI00355A9875|nr:Hypoxanthine-guanine phosphoribosyltransferase [Phytophthora cinnamomi]
MGKERFTINPFPALALTDVEKHQLLELGRTIIEANFERDNPFFQGGRRVDPHRWKLSKERERMRVFTERPEYVGADAMSNTSSSKLPAILSVGRVEGKLDDMMYGVVNPTLEDMRIKASGCKIKKKISIVTADLALSEKKITFCSACLADASTSSAVDIAAAQILENTRKDGIARSVTSHSSSSSDLLSSR